MKRTALLIIMFVILSGCGTVQTIVEVSDDIDLPEKVLIIAQSGTSAYLYQTVIDLANNEIVILTYSQADLWTVIRTGIFADPDDYRNMTVQSTDNPEQPKPIENSTNNDGSVNNDNNPATSF